ncbi:Ferrochelatase-2, chloroplastic [Seminavis robusta]|uniref:Ferrochelatase n=1 Tax=Seminavis robusta TaxID=568900 RepID=A0A9N8EKD1_9STRA|nr:Ferrochelatase-2, chloroplastic [Seminavis robusta]|eukprot:Sro1126_g244070.1 Ferrochelatase-2, chloroplastic (497) ;mRNA; r:16500-18088
MRRQGQLSSLAWTAVLLLLLVVLVPECSSFATTPSPLTRRQVASTTSSQRQASVALPADAASQANNKNQASENSDDPKVGVLLLNLGGPETGDDVEGFLFNLFADPDIIRLPGLLSPLQTLIATFISKRRAPKSRAAYESIGGGSPILQYSNAQAKLISESLAKRHGISVQTYIGMRYWHPFTEDALKQIQRDHIDALVIVPLYPQFSISTSGSSFRVLQEEFSKDASKFGDMVHTVVSSWYDRPGYVNAMTKLIEHELQSFTEEQIQEAQSTAPDLEPLHILFSAHGVPQSYIEAGDPYQTQIMACVDRITNAITHPHVQVHLSYQSRVGPIEWLRPYTDDVLPELAQKGVRNLVVVPISFVSEHIETLEEIDIEYRELAEESGITNWRRCPALNTEASFIDDMADMVMDALEEPAQTVTEACVANNVGDVELQPLDERVGISTVGVGGVGAGDEEVLLKEPERLLARIAIAGVFITFLVELFSGSSMVDLFFGS